MTLLGAGCVFIGVSSLTEPLRTERNCTLLTHWTTPYDCEGYVSIPGNRDQQYCSQAVPVFHFAVWVDGREAEMCGEAMETCHCCKDAGRCVDSSVNGLVSFDCAPILREPLNTSSCWEDNRGRLFWRQTEPHTLHAVILLVMGSVMLVPCLCLSGSAVCSVTRRARRPLVIELMST